MKNLATKGIALVITLVTVLSVATLGVNAKFDAETSLDKLVDAGIFCDKTIVDPIDRATLATVIYRIQTGKFGGYTEPSKVAFNDVPANAWYAEYVAYAANTGAMNGTGNGSFSPAAKVNGFTALTALIRAAGLDPDGRISGPFWQLEAVRIADEQGVIDALGDGVDLYAPLSRANLAIIIDALILS